MKKLTRNQALYQKEIKRIRTNLSKLRRQGYDVSELASRYTSKLPNRVTSKMLSELHNITPKKLKLELTNNYVAYTPKPRTPLTTKPQNYKEVFAPSSFPTFPVKSNYQYIPPVPTGFMDIPSVLPDEETFEETIPDFTPEETEQETERLTQEIVDLDKGKVLTVDVETNEIIDEAPLYIEDDFDGTELYINGDTGEIVGKRQYETFTTPDMDQQALDKLADIINQFPYKFKLAMQNTLAQMIDEKGLQEVAKAFTQTYNTRPNILDKLSNAQERYEEAVAILEDMADILDLPIQLREEVKDYVYRESMADIETYGT